MYKVTSDILNEIDFDELSEALVSSIDSFVEQVAVGAVDEWTRQAQNSLKSSRAEYIKGLQENDSFKKTGRRQYEVSLVGFLPNAVESGMDPTDLKPGLLSGKSSKIGKGGYRYATVPFRHYPSSTTANRQSKNFAKELKDIVKQTGMNKIKPGVKGRVAAIKEAKNVKKLKPYHANNPLSGLTKYQNVYKSGATQGSYFTFRRVSESPNAKAAARRRGIDWNRTWFHPGLKGVKLLDKVAEWAEAELEQGISQILGGA